MTQTRPGRPDIGTVDELHEAATRMTGLSDFGDPAEYLEGMQVLLDSFAKDEQLTPFGNKAVREQVRGALAARAIANAAFAANPSYADVPIERPIVVTGLPRTGTTALHRMLCDDPNAQGLDMWLTTVPQPRPPRAEWADNPIFAHLQASFDRHHRENPEFMAVHYIAADTVEECWQVLRQTFHSIAYETLGHLPTYSAWLQQQDWTPAYRRHKQNLQLIGRNDVGKRWVLKNPSHMHALDALMAVYPDALVIQMHRDPRTVVASMSSLAAHATVGQSELFVGEMIGRTQLELWARGAELFRDARAKYDAAQFLDVDYRDFTADPVGTVARVYEYFRLGDPPPPVPHGQAEAGAEHRFAHRYSLADFGLTGEEVDARFAGLRD